MVFEDEALLWLRYKEPSEFHIVRLQSGVASSSPVMFQANVIEDELEFVRFAIASGAMFTVGAVMS